MVATPFDDSPPAAKTLLLKHVAAVGIGNALEFYDFLTFSIFAVQIGHAFFPWAGAKDGLLYTLATFGVGFVTRPLGGVFIGRYGDRAGRRPAMILSFALMGLGMLGLALTPSYAAIGMAAPVLLLLFRLVQGFALGGEVGPSTAFLIEAAPTRWRGFFVSLQNGTQGVAVLASGLVGVGLSSALSPTALDAWGWRVALMIGVAVVPLGLYIRRNLPETLGAPANAGEKDAPPVNVRLVALALIVLSAGTVATYVTIYLSTYAQDSLKLPARVAFGATIIAGLASVFGNPLGGLLTDLWGRKRVMLASSAGLALLVVPGFVLMNHWPGAAALYVATALIATVKCFMTSAGIVAVTESLPRSVRSGGIAILYAVAIAAFGGTAQYVSKFLTDLTGSPLAPAWYLTGAIVIGGGAMALLRETKPPAA
jgi:MFS family permease